MPRKSDNIAINNELLDRRVKVTKFKRKLVIYMYAKGIYTQTALGKRFGVTRHAIRYIIYPESLAQNKLRRAERGGTMQYYNREKNTIKQNEHRLYKKDLHAKNLI